MTCHTIYNKLSKGLQPKYDPDLALDYEFEEVKDKVDFAAMVDEIVFSLKSGDISKVSSAKF